MGRLSRRSVLGASLGLAATGPLARPFIANAAARTATVWWQQGFVPEEDESFRSMVAGYEKVSGNKIDYSLTPFGPLLQKIIASLNSGDVPDVIEYDAGSGNLIPQTAWDGKLVDLTDIVEPQKSQLHPTAYLAAQYYNSAAKKRSIYLAPLKIAAAPFHIWGSLVNKAGYTLADAPKTWDAFFDFFKPMQAKLRDQGMRRVYALGLQPTTVGPADGNALFHHFLIANGGYGFITPDGRAHLDDPQVEEAVIKSLTYITTAFKGGYVPPAALSWSDADDNNGFHAKLFVMDLDGTISTEVALIHDKDQYDDIITLGLPLDNVGKQMPEQIGVEGAVIPKGAKNPEVAKEFLKYVIQPQVINAYLKAGLGRWLPTMPSLVKNDPYWLDPTDPHRKAYVEEGLVNPTAPSYTAFNPGYAAANAQQIWGVAHADIILHGMTPQEAAKGALKKIAAILAKYPIVQA
ncbi:MAG: carbohydrate ABC transporter substrate-binding protein [Acetobacteraceae bacterium]|nr:carbohydrate ABC transporter substrate-binding protein [Acetobacteraceae bacterium]